MVIICFCTFAVHAELVDLWEFSSRENQARATELAKELRCPQCQNQNLQESTSPIARDLRLEVYRMVEAGKSNDEIVTVMTDRYGDFVLYKPKLTAATWLLWGAPFLLLLIGVVMLWVQCRKNRKTTLMIDDKAQAAIAQFLAEREKRP